MIVEDLELAKAAARRIYAEVVGYGNAADAWDLIQPVDKGDGVRRAMEMAIARHGVPRDEIDLINPHGTSTPLGDLREAEAIRAVFPDRYREVAISGTKSMTGHLMGAAGAVEGVFTVLSVHHQVAPATQNYLEPDPEIDLDIVHGESREMEHPLRHERQHRPGRPQRRHHLQALRGRLSDPGGLTRLAARQPPDRGRGLRARIAHLGQTPAHGRPPCRARSPGSRSSRSSPPLDALRPHRPSRRQAPSQGAPRASQDRR